ncbi:MAG TPA: hypothetical protein VLJ79_19840, partial [Candidatus Binatia bacterium]|nr:hypothetical protein [Candidatus Binatia bacterium]
MNKSILLLMFAVLFGPAAALVDAQQSARVPRIGYLSNGVAPIPNEPDFGEEAFRRGLRELGYVEGKTILIEHRYAEGVEDRFP